MNAASSRSHCLFMLAVQQIDPGKPEEVQAEGKLTLVDLAGSERQQALIDVKKAALQDSVDINKSLFTLRKVILALSDGGKPGGSLAKHIPFRDSVLTKLLKHALGGNCHTVMLACVSPSDAYAEENSSTLAYAARARSITNAPVLNVDPKTAAMLKLKDEIATLKGELGRLQQLVLLGEGGGGGGGDGGGEGLLCKACGMLVGSGGGGGGGGGGNKAAVSEVNLLLEQTNGATKDLVALSQQAHKEGYDGPFHAAEMAALNKQLAEQGARSAELGRGLAEGVTCLLYTSPSPRDS